jgi:hypothetical protein
MRRPSGRTLPPHGHRGGVVARLVEDLGWGKKMMWEIKKDIVDLQMRMEISTLQHSTCMTRPDMWVMPLCRRF